MITYERSTLNEQRKVYWARRCGSPKLYATPFPAHVTLLHLDLDQTSNPEQSLTFWMLLIAKDRRLDGIFANDNSHILFVQFVETFAYPVNFSIAFLPCHRSDSI
jgi:hypothetical protein